MAKTGSKTVSEAQARNRDKGGGRLTMNLTPDENELWTSLVGKFPAGRGQQKAAFMAAVHAALSGDNGKLSKEQLIAEIERRLK